MTIDITNLNGNVIGTNKPLNGIAEVSNVRSIFTQYCQQRSAILDQEACLCNTPSPWPYSILATSCRGILSNSYRVIESEFLLKPFIFKYKQVGKKTKLLPLDSYYVGHLVRSLAKTVMAEESIEIFVRAKRTAYILYDYWFHKKEYINDISFNVRTDLKNIISYIIDVSYKEEYKHLDTTSMVEALRLKLDAEELLASTQ